MSYELLIHAADGIYFPIIQEGITLESERKGSPSKLTFTVIKDKDIAFNEGDGVSLKVDGKNVFFGFVFTKSRDKNHHIQVTAYDQLRYLKNKDTYVYENKTASEFLRMIIDDFNLKAGDIDDTRFKIEARVEDNQTLFDMIYNALDLTMQNRNKLYVLYDNYGQICLKDIDNMKLDLVIDDETACDIDYSSSIDSNTYNKIKLVKDNEETGKREVYISQSSESMNNWGVLQYFEKINENTSIDISAKADALLEYYNQVTRTLEVKDCFGDTRVRGGSSVAVNLYLGDLTVKTYMVVDKVTHTFSNDEHMMTLRLIGNSTFYG